MSVAIAFENIRSLRDLPALAVDLGFTATWHQMARPGTGSPEPLFLIGRKGGLLAIAGESNDPGREARRLAKLFGDRAREALILCIEPKRRLLAVSVTGVEAPVATIELDRVSAIDRRILDRGRSITVGSPLEASLAWAEAIAGQPVGQRFFDRFREVLGLAREALPRPIPPRDRHALGLLALSRVLFLYFVQERGWLDGRQRFLREELDRCLAGPGGVERRLLQPLFFGTLNRPADHRSAAVRRFGRIPFLNGGLFEPHPLEQRWHPALPDGFWIEVFDDLFERYHFTVEEGSHRGAIGPDMLGKVFEGVMDPEDRRDTGAFYTPSRLVDQVVGAALEAWMDEPGRGPGPLVDRIRSITVLDPAVGSGAFLMGMLKRLVRLRVAAGEAPGPATRAVVSTNLFGVDRNPSAVRLAELRLWLAVIEADDSASPEAVAPLPNLDALVRQGDSVVEPITLPFTVREEDGTQVAALRRAVVAATGPLKRRTLRALRHAELRAARSGINAALAGTEGQLRDLLAVARAPSLFGERSGLSKDGSVQVTKLRQRRTRLRAIERRLAQADELPWFHYQTQFADVMARGGFDLVVGNPPWVRAEAIAPAMRAAFKVRYRWFRTSGGRGFRHLPDLSVVFLERALELVKPGGTVGFLVPAKLLTAQYAVAARTALARQTSLHVVATIDQRDPAFDATVYPLALVASRRPPAPGDRFATCLGGSPEIAQASLGDAEWFLGGAAIAELRAVAASHPTVADRFGCRLGVKTGANDIFLDPAVADRGRLRPVVRGRDISPFQVKIRSRMLWTHDPSGAPLERLPADIEAHFLGHRARLVRRTDYRSGPYWRVFRTEIATARYRVVWPDLARQLTAVALVGGSPERSIPLNTCYAIAAPDAESALALAAWFNSTPIRNLAAAVATVAASGFRRFNSHSVGNLPLPMAALGDPELRRIGTSAHGTNAVDQASLDRRVTQLLQAEVPE